MDKFYVKDTSVHFYVDEPTCANSWFRSRSERQSAATEVTFGNSYVSEVKISAFASGNSFSIRAEYCYASKITVKVKAAK